MVVVALVAAWLSGESRKLARVGDVESRERFVR